MCFQHMVDIHLKNKNIDGAIQPSEIRQRAEHQTRKQSVIFWRRPSMS